jgi:hypothetical protein
MKMNRVKKKKVIEITEDTISERLKEDLMLVLLYSANPELTINEALESAQDSVDLIKQVPVH